MNAACIILTMGTRPDDLARAVASVRAQTVPVEPVVVDNGGMIEPVEGARMIRLPENLGPTGGRNRAIEQVGADLLFFLDDDAAFGQPDLVERALAMFEADRRLGVCSFRIVDPSGAPPQRRHVPRLRAGDPERSSDVTVFLEGACAIRREALEGAGLYPEDFGFGHEGVDLAWRLLDAGYRIRYTGELVVHHPAEPPTRHGDFHYLTARNRVFVARRLLPLPLAFLYVTTWIVLGLGRAASPRARHELLRGFRDGLRLPCGSRRPIRWRTVWRMTRLGRPPVV